MSAVKRNRRARAQAPDGGEWGVAVLETAVFAALLLSFSFGVVALVDYLQQRRFAAQLVDKHLHQSGVRPFVLNESNNVVTDRAKLEDYISQAKDLAAADLVRQREAGEASAFVETIYAEVPIDTVSGRSVGQPRVLGRQVWGGSGFVPPDLLISTDLETMMESYLSRGQETFVFASPTALGPAAPGGRFLPRAVLVGMRAFYGSSGGLSQTLRSVVGLEPVFHGAKVIALRGDLDL